MAGWSLLALVTGGDDDRQVSFVLRDDGLGVREIEVADNVLRVPDEVWQGPVYELLEWLLEQEGA